MSEYRCRNREILKDGEVLTPSEVFEALTTLTEERDRLKEVIKEATDMDIKQARWESLGGNTVTLGRSTQLLLAVLTPQEPDNG